jgi:hypothetical protein
VPALSPPLAWTALSCFGYSPDEKAFGCLDFSLNSDEWPVDSGEWPDDDDVHAMDFEQWKPIPDVAWSGHKAIALVGKGEPDSVDIASKEYDDSSTIVHARTERDALREVADRGYGTVAASAAALPSGEWVAVDHTWLKFETYYHEGDASSYSIGSLELRCTPPDAGGAAKAKTELLGDRRGALATSFTAPGASFFVVGVMKAGGGEGSHYFSTEYIAVDPAAHCGGR